MEKALIGVAGAIVGIIVGHILGARSEHKQWRRNRKHEEFRELVTGLVAAIMEQQKFIASSKPGDSPSQMFGDQYLALRTIADRIFIREDIRPLRVDEEYMNAMKDFGNDRDFDKFGTRTGKLIDRIVDVAEKL